MKITYIMLKNFSAIETGMHKKKLEIDFSNTKNTVVLLVGPNGSGKTALLSTLHPFAYPGTMDVRANSSMIIADCDGEKEIHYDKSGVKYVIHHYYKNSKRGLTVKSFITKNGNELNPNGNVTSFNEIVYDELGIQSDYMKLLRLGSNVTNLIEMKASERKSFTSDLISELNMWLELYKKVSEDNRVLKGLLNTVTNKLQRLNITDKDILKQQIKTLENRINNTTDNITDLKHQLGGIDGIINTLVPEGVDSLRRMLLDYNNDSVAYIQKMKDINKKIQKMTLVVCGDVSNEINLYNSKLTEFKTRHEMKKELYTSNQTMLNDAFNKYDEIESKLKTVVSVDTIKSLQDMKTTLQNKIDTIPDEIKKSQPIIDKESLFLAINVLNEIDRLVSKCYEFGDKALRYCISLVKNDDDVEDIISNRVMKIDREISTLTATDSISTTKPCFVVFRPPGCVEDNCPFIDIYETLFGDRDNKNSDKLTKLEHEREFLLNVSYINKNINYIKIICRSNASLSSKLLKLNIDYLELKHILSAMYNNEPIFSEASLTEIIRLVEIYEDYQQAMGKLKDVDLELATLQSNDNLVLSLKDKQRDICDEITKLQFTVNSLNKELNELQLCIDDTSEYIDELTKYKTYVDEYNEISDKCDNVLGVIKDKNAILESVARYVNDKNFIESQLNIHATNLERLNKELFDAKFKLKSYNTLCKEREFLNERFEEISITKEALSSTKGAPLLFIRLYLQSTTMFVNEILSTVYDNFEIAGFEITDTEFNIPYIKNGVKINDVLYASQGERSFLALALSFALINKSINDYNIMLLDEIDATLDSRNRAMFLNILINMIETINSEQVLICLFHRVIYDSPSLLIAGTNSLSYNY